MTFERSTDTDLIKRIMTHPDVYDLLSDDGCPAPEDWTPVIADPLWWIIARDGDDVLGLWLMAQQNAVCYEAHTCLLPSAGGLRKVRAVREVIQWAWANTPARRVVTNVPSYNQAALRFAKMAGLEEFGVNPRSFLKRGVLWSQIMLGISKPEGL